MTNPFEDIKKRREAKEQAARELDRKKQKENADRKALYLKYNDVVMPILKQLDSYCPNEVIEFVFNEDAVGWFIGKRTSHEDGDTSYSGTLRVVIKSEKNDYTERELKFVLYSNDVNGHETSIATREGLINGIRSLFANRFNNT